MLTYDLDARGSTPRYQYLYQRIRDDILDGRIAPREKLPSKRALAAHLRTSVITVENAYQLLMVEGYIHSRDKVGYFAEELRPRPAAARAPQAPPRVPRIVGGAEHACFADFSSNRIQTSLFPLSALQRLLREAIALDDPALFGTIPSNGTEILRHAIADYLRRFRGMDVDPEQVVVGCGTEYLYSRLMQLFGEDTVLGLEDPGNHKFADIAARYRIRSEYVPVGPEGVLLDALGRGGASLLHLSPANSFPFGAVMPIRKRLDVLSWLYERDGRYLVEDDFDSEITSLGGAAMPIFHYDDRGRTVYLNTFSKTMLPSLRVAYMVLPPRLLARYRETTTFYSCTVSGADQYAYARFISEGHFERHLSRLNTFFRAQRKRVLAELDLVGLGARAQVTAPPAGTHVTLELGAVAPGAERMRERARELDIRFASVADYAARPTEEMARQLVVNYASVPPERLHEALLRLAACAAPESE